MVAVAKRNINVALVFTFLYQLKAILIDYFKVLEEETVRDNFVLIYELLDEIMDHGYPQVTEAKILQDFITTESNKKKGDSLISILTNAVSWRQEGIKYTLNETFLDVIEKVDMLVSSDGNILHSKINGSIQMKSFLSGMPTVTLGINDKMLFENRPSDKEVEMDDLKFHQCVNKKLFESERVIQFIPPDGGFELMSYRLDKTIKPLLFINVSIDNKSDTRIEYSVTVRANYKSKSVANKVDIFIPVPSDIQNATFVTPKGKVVYLSDREDLMWTISKFEGQKELKMTCNFQVPTIRIADPQKHLKRPIQLEFEIPHYTISGFQVKYVNVEEKSKYESTPWVRYIARSGSYDVRIL